MEIQLKKPLEHDGKKIEKLVLNLDGLTGLDMEFCAREARAARGDATTDPSVVDNDFHAQVAARAAGLPTEALRRLGAQDYMAVITYVQGFLLGASV